MEKREHEAVSHVKDSMQIAEGALLEREEANIREQQLEKQVGRLRTSVTTVVREAGERTKREVRHKRRPNCLHFTLTQTQITLLREECNKNIDKMGVEIHRLEEVCITIMGRAIFDITNCAPLHPCRSLQSARPSWSAVRGRRKWWRRS